MRSIELFNYWTSYSVRAAAEIRWDVERGAMRLTFHPEKDWKGHEILGVHISSTENTVEYACNLLIPRTRQLVQSNCCHCFVPKNWAKLATPAMTAWCLCIRSIERYKNKVACVPNCSGSTCAHGHCPALSQRARHKSGCLFQHVHMFTVSPDYASGETCWWQNLMQNCHVEEARFTIYCLPMLAVFLWEKWLVLHKLLQDLSSALVNMLVHKCELSQAHEAHVGNEIRRAPGRVEDLPVSFRWSFVQSFWRF